MTWVRKASRMAARAASGCHDTDARQHVGGDHVPPPGAGEEGSHPVGGVGVAGHDDGRGEPPPCQALGVVEEDVGVAPVGAADEEDEVGCRGAQGGDVGAGHRPARDVHDLRTGGQPDAVPGLGRHLALVAHDRQAEPAPGAGAREHLVGLAVAGQGGAHGIHAVHDVGGDGRRVARGAEDVARGGVDEHGLGERRPDVDAEDERHRCQVSRSSAWRRSATRSSASSMPTERRMRSDGTSSAVPDDRRVGHQARVLDERLDPAEGLAEDPQLGLGADLRGDVLAAPDPERDHASEPLHLPGGDVVVGVVGQAGVVHGGDALVGRGGSRRPPRRCRSAAPCAPPASSGRAARATRRTDRRRRPSRSGGTQPVPRPTHRRAWWRRRPRRPHHRRRRCGHRRTWSSSGRRRRRRGRSAAAGRARRRCCRRRAAHRPRASPSRWPRCRRCRAAGSSASRARPSSSRGGSPPAPTRRRRRCRSSAPPPTAGRPGRTAGRCRRRRRTARRRGHRARAGRAGRVSSPARPLANAKPRSPPSRAAMHSSSAVRVGFAERLYS